MSRIRTIKPEFWKHEELSSLSAETHMLAAALLNFADDEGYFNANPRLIQAECFPLRDLSVTITVSLTELSRIGYLRFGNGPDGKRYGHIIKFSEHQVVNHGKASKIKDVGIVWEEYGNSTVSVPPEGKGKEGNKEGKEICTKARSRVSYSSDFEEFWKAYPDTSGTSKADAFREWGKLTEDERKAAIAGIPEFRAWVAKQGKDYRIVHPCRYLSQRRFESLCPKPEPPDHGRKVYVQYGTDAGDEWTSWYRKQGKVPPRDGRGGWWFESERPPAEQAA